MEIFCMGYLKTLKINLLLSKTYEYRLIMKKIRIQTKFRNEILDITDLINNYLSEEKINSGIVIVYSPHTTAGISVNENADPDVKKDILTYLNKLIPQNANFNHIEGNSDAHIKTALVNSSQTFIVEDGKLQLGTWQSVFFMEFDGPRQREVWVKIIN